MRDWLQSASMPILAMLIQATIVAGAALLAVRLPAGRNAAFRIAVNRAALSSMLILVVVAPAFRTITAPLIQLRAAGNPSVLSTDSRQQGQAFNKDSEAVVSPVKESPSGPAPNKTLGTVDQTAADLSAPLATQVSPRLGLLEAFSLAYIAGFVVLFGGVVSGSAWLWLLRRNAIPHERIRRAVSSSQVKCAFVSGFLKPTIYLPAEIETYYPPEMVDAVVRHESTHIERRDCQWNLVSRVACAVTWMSPLTWILASNLRQDSEALCDRLVLESGVEPSLYAGCLLKIAESFASSSAERLAGVGIVASNSQLRKRITLMLNSSALPIFTLSRAWKLGIGFVSVVVLSGATMVVSASPARGTRHDATPTDTIKGFFDALNKQDWQGMISRIEGAKMEVVPQLEKLPRAQYHPVKQVPQIGDVSITGDNATVHFAIQAVGLDPKAIRYVPRQETARLHRVGGDWKIVGGEAHGVLQPVVDVAHDPSKIAKARSAMKRTIVLSNLKILTLGVMLYANDHAEKFPPSQAKLRADLEPYLRMGPGSASRTGTMWNDADGKPLDVHINPLILGKPMAKVPFPANCVLLSLGTQGHLQTVEGMVPIGFCDGHVKYFRPEDAAKLSWK